MTHERQAEMFHKEPPCFCAGCLTIAALMAADPNPTDGHLLERVGMALGYAGLPLESRSREDDA